MRNARPLIPSISNSSTALAVLSGRFSKKEQFQTESSHTVYCNHNWKRIYAICDSDVVSIKQSTNFADNDIHCVYTFSIGSSGSEIQKHTLLFICFFYEWNYCKKKNLSTNCYFVSNKLWKRNRFPYSFIFTQ